MKRNGEHLDLPLYKKSVYTEGGVDGGGMKSGDLGGRGGENLRGL